MNKYETAATLLKMMYDANNADHNEAAQDWQTPDMASTLFKQLDVSLRSVLGDELVDYLAAGGFFVGASEIERCEKQLAETNALDHPENSASQHYAAALLNCFFGDTDAALKEFLSDSSIEAVSDCDKEWRANVVKSLMVAS